MTKEILDKEIFLLKNISSDYNYIQSVKEKHKLLVEKASNGYWQFKNIQIFPDSTGVCEFGDVDDKRHIGLKYIIRLENIKDKSLISVGRGCYKKLMGHSKKVVLPTLKEWETNKDNLKNADIKYRELQHKFYLFINSNLPSLLNTAQKYKINFDLDKFQSEVENPNLIGLAVERVRILVSEINDLERTNQILHQKQLIIQKMQGESNRIEKPVNAFQSNQGKTEKYFKSTKVENNNVSKFLEQTEQEAKAIAKTRIQNKRISNEQEYATKYIKKLLKARKSYADVLLDLELRGLNHKLAKTRLNKTLKTMKRGGNKKSS